MTPPVMVFTHPNCSFCKELKEYLDLKHVSYYERDVSSDRTAVDVLQQINASWIVPVTLIHREAVLGFDVLRLDALLTAKQELHDVAA